MSGDDIKNLPIDENNPTHAEIQLVENVFSDKNGIEKIFSGIKDVLLLCFLFIILSLPYVDSLVFKFYPSAENSPYTLILIKSILFGIAYFIVKNIYLVRK